MYTFRSFLSTFSIYIFKPFVKQDITEKKYNKIVKENYLNIENNAVKIYWDTKVLEV